MFPVLINAGSGIRRSELQQWMEAHGVDTRMVWTGNAARQPAFRDKPHRVPAGGLPNADRVMEWGLDPPQQPLHDRRRLRLDRRLPRWVRDRAGPGLTRPDPRAVPPCQRARCSTRQGPRLRTTLAAETERQRR